MHAIARDSAVRDTGALGRSRSWSMAPLRCGGMDARPPLAVLIAGGGVAALEAALALRDLAGDLVSLRILAPNGDFGYRPLSVREPFAHAKPERYSLSELAASVGADLIEGEFAYLDADRRVAFTASGDELPYDALLLGLGARTKDAFPHVTTIDAGRMDELLHGLVQDVEDGYARSVAFASPSRQGWALPLYELALMTAARAHEMGVAVELTVVTPESSPLAFFGERASHAVATLLDDAGVGVIGGVDAHVPEPGELLLMPGERTLKADRIVALPELFGPAVRGLPTGEHGFIPVDGHGRVRGVEAVWLPETRPTAPSSSGASQRRRPTLRQLRSPLSPERMSPRRATSRRSTRSSSPVANRAT